MLYFVITKQKWRQHMILHNYLSNSGRDLIYEYINSLPEAEKIDGYTVLQHMEKGEFDKILFKRWEKKVYEVYFQKNNRVFYITVDKENIYLLHSCRKQKNKTEKKDANIVRKRAKELGNMLGRKFI
jgi:phage-related protein